MKQRNKTGNCSSSGTVHSPVLPFHISLSLCLTVGANCVAGQWQMCCIAASLHERRKKKKKKKSCLVLHMSALFLELLRSWPHYTDLHTRSPFSVALCASLQVNSRMQMSTFSQGAGWLREAYICVCVCQRVCVCVCAWVLLAEGMRG